jgi:hypothetical protein
MWMCDACEEINDDNVTVCTRCRRPFRPDDLGVAARGIDEGEDLPAFEGERCVRNQPSLVPVYVISALIFLVNVIPVLVHGVSFAVVGLGIASCACLWGATYYLWRDADLMLRGVRAEGTVLSIDYVIGGGRSQVGSYFTNAKFTVAGKSYFIRSEFGTTFQRYEVGGTATVWYDPGNPGLAVLGHRLAYQHIALLVAGAILCFLAYNMNLVYVLPDRV